MHKDEILLEQAYHKIYEDNNPFKPASGSDIKDRKQQHLRLANQKLQDYIKAGSVGTLDLQGSPIQSLPDDLKVGGYLDLSDTQIQSLPDDLKVDGYLDVSDTPIQSLPPGLEVGGNLYLVGSPIQSLPTGLKVGGNLYLTGSSILELPSDLEVGDNLHLFDTPIARKHTIEDIRKMCPRLKGRIIV